MVVMFFASENRLVFRLLAVESIRPPKGGTPNAFSLFPGVATRHEGSYENVRQASGLSMAS
jgi:hypothetical protein